MKIRQGFVSNSSSTSFCIYGVRLKEVNEDLEALADKEGLKVSYGEYDDYYIGRAWSSIKDDETGKQFKDSIEAAVKKILPDKDVKCYTYEESWYNG